MGRQGRARELADPWILSGGAEPRAVVQRGWLTDGTDSVDLGTHADGAVRRVARIGRRCGVPGELQGEQFCDGNRLAGGWRFLVSDDLNGKAGKITETQRHGERRASVS